MSKLITGNYYKLSKDYKKSGSFLLNNLFSVYKNEPFKCIKAYYYSEDEINVLFEGQTIHNFFGSWTINSYTSKFLDNVSMIKQEELDV
jgi:hypothetical protein